MSKLELLNPTNSALILIDHQPQMAFGVQSIDRQTLKNNTVGLAKAAKLFNVPTILTSVETESFSGYIWPELLGELSSQPGAAERIARMTGPGAPLHMAYSLAPAKQDFNHDMVVRLLRDAQDPTGWCCWSFSNHDVERVASRWGASDPRLAKLAMALLLTVRGSVCIYQGEELSLPEASLAYEDLQDPFGKRYWPEFAGRDGARTPMPWDHTKLHAGFSTNTPWLPVPSSHERLSVDLQEQDSNSSLHQWRALLNVRRQHLALQKGSLRMLDLNAPLAGMVREHEGQKIMCLMNISPHAQRVDLQGMTSETLWSSDPTSTLSELGPWGCMILRL